jgi:hypothetical protein
MQVRNLNGDDLESKHAKQSKRSYLCRARCSEVLPAICIKMYYLEQWKSRNVEVSEARDPDT